MKRIQSVTSSDHLLSHEPPLRWFHPLLQRPPISTMIWKTSTERHIHTLLLWEERLAGSSSWYARRAVHIASNQLTNKQQTESIPSKQFKSTPPSLHGSVNPAVRPSLVVKLNIRRPSGTMNVETRRKHKSPSSDAITKDDTAMKEGAVSQGTSYVRTHEWRRETRSTAPITRRRQGDLAADGAHNDTAPDHTYPSTIAVASTIYQNMRRLQSELSTCFSRNLFCTL